jgi:hypothetical protein
MLRNILYALLLAPVGFAQAPSASQIAERLTANNLKADVSFLASDALQGRGTPSPGLDIAAEFIASQFRAAGLDPAGDDGYFQTAPFVQVTPDQEGRSLTLEIGGKTITVDPAKFAVSDTVAAVDLKEAPVFAAMTLDALTPEQVRGKVLIVLVSTGGRRRLNPAVLATLQPALVINLAAGAGLPPGPPRVRPADAPSVPTLTVWDPAMTEAVTPGSADAKITVHVAAPKIDPVRLRNVVGVLRGSDPALRDTYILVTGHYDHLGVRGTGSGDHIFNGANDDASGTSCVIEIARTLASLPTRPKRSIVFLALFGEEMGLLGSRYYAAHPIFPLAKTVADLNLEQMGRTDDNTGPRVGVVNATGFDFTDITTLLAKAGDDFGIKLAKDEQNSDPFFARSDNQALADAGIPSHTFSVGYVFPDYHGAGDEWPKIDYENMAKVDRTIALGLWRIADSADVPHWNAANPKTEPYRKAAEALRK